MEPCEVRMTYDQLVPLCLVPGKLFAFATFISACKEAFSAMLGKFEFQDIVDNSALAPWLFFLFNILQV